MKSYQSTLSKKNGELFIGKIIEKEVSNPMFIIEEDKMTILDVYDQELGKTVQFITAKKPTLEAFLDGFSLGMKANTLL